MGMSTHVIGIRPPDERWQAMFKIYKACEDVGIDPPDEVIEFFGGDDGEPDPSGVKVRIMARSYKDGMSEGFEVDVRELPPDVTVVRFFNSW